MKRERQVPNITSQPPHIAIVGAGLAGTRLVKSLRRRGFQGRISLFGDEEGLPYDRPPLTKNFLTSAAALEPHVLLNPREIETFDVNFRPGAPVRAGAELLIGSTGEVADADVVVVATGASPRRLLQQPLSPRIHTLRTHEEASRLRDAFTTSRSIIVVGGGILGGEIATAARTWGLETCVVETSRTPFLRALGRDAAEILTNLHRSQGVTFHLGTQVRNWDVREDSVTVTLDGTAEITADHVVVSVGSKANTDWLEADRFDSLELDQDGRVTCDSHGRVIGRPNWFAIGDAAHWVTPGDRHPDQMQHWTRAVDQAETVAAVIASRFDTASAEDVPPLGVPYVWTTQAGQRIQCFGDLGRGTRSALFATDQGESIVIVERDGLVTGVALVGLPRLMGLARDLVAERAAMASVTSRLAATPHLFSLVTDTLIAS